VTGSDDPNDRIAIRAHYYQQFDADYSLDVPAEAYGGWKTATLEISRRHSALVVMHAWGTGTPEQYPGWWRAVEYMPRAQRILQDVFPPLLRAARHSGFRVYHVAGGGSYARRFPGYHRTVELAGPEPPSAEPIEPDPVLLELRAFRAANVHVGTHNEEDVAKGFAALDFAPQAYPQDNEAIAETGRQLLALCRADGVNHLIYAGFALNWCLLLSPGGMGEMARYGLMCSVLRQATTAVENRETARRELCKEVALWRVALAFGFVFDVDDFVAAIQRR